MNPNTSFPAAQRHPLKRDEVETRACQSKFEIGSLNGDYTRLNGYLDALGMSSEERGNICKIVEANLGNRDAGEDRVTPLVCLFREVNTLSEVQHSIEASSGKSSDSTEAFLEWRLRVWLSRESRPQTELLSTDIRESDHHTMKIAPAIERTTMPTACIENNFLRTIAVFSLERLSMVRAIAVQTYRRLSVGA